MLSGLRLLGGKGVADDDNDDMATDAQSKPVKQDPETAEPDEDRESRGTNVGSSSVALCL